MNSTLLRINTRPCEIGTLTDPTPNAKMEDPPTPFTGCGGVGVSDLKSDRMGVM